MAEKVRCETCDRTFKDAEGLSQHNAAKHSSNVTHHKVDKSKVKNRIVYVVVIGAIFVFILWAVIGAISESRACKTAPAAEMNIGGHTNLKLHIHANLRILINGQLELIPPNIGISAGIMRPVHTHEPDGVVHMEGACVRDFKLDDFFEVWGKEFNSQCIFENCANSGVLRMSVNGKENNEFGDYIMRDEDSILIEYNSN